jgi:hypothetical protein
VHIPPDPPSDRRRDRHRDRHGEHLLRHFGHLDAVRMTELPDLDPRMIPIAASDPEHGW